MCCQNTDRFNHERVPRVIRWSSRRTNPHLALHFMMVIVASRVSVNQSAPVANDTNFRHYSCNDDCEYDDWFHRARCEERSLYQVPSSTGCTDAIMLEIQENNINRLTVKCLAGYVHVRTLDASRNNISVIDPGSLMCVPRLRNLLVSYNKISDLSNGTFTGTENHLERIYLNHNELTYIDEDAFKNLINVVIISLTHNYIETLPPRVFYGMSKLRHLHLGKNKLISVHQNIFSGLTKLERLDLNNNKLTEIPVGLFDGLESLREVLLSGNDITSLPAPDSLGHLDYELFDIANNKLNRSVSILSYLEIADRIYIDGNPFNCDCDFLLVQRWYQHISPTERQRYEERDSIACGDYSIDDDLTFTCDLKNATATPERTTLKIHSTIDITENSSSITGQVVLASMMSTPHEYSVSEERVNSLCRTDSVIFFLSAYNAVLSTIVFVVLIPYVYQKICNGSSNRQKKKKKHKQ